jgi:Tol biopolymer transport system component
VAARAHVIAVLAFAAPLSAVAAPTASAVPATERVDVAAGGSRPELGGVSSSLSAGGRFVAFSSSANDLTSDDTHEGAMGRDVFVRDRSRGSTSRVSEATDGSQGDGESDEPSISAGGRFVAFSSFAGNFAAGDSNGNSDVFVHDRRSGTTSLVSVASNGTPANSFSGDPAISGDGRFVAFESLASNLAPVAGLLSRVYVHDRRTGRTTLVSGRSVEGSDPSISADGRVVAFTRRRGRKTSIHVHDRRTRRTRRVDVSSRERPADRPSSAPSLSSTGRYIAFASRGRNLVPGDRNGGADVFLRDRARGTTRRVSIRPDGRAVRRCPPSPEPGNLPAPLCAGEPAVSGDGRLIAFRTEVRRFDDAGVRGGVFVRDRRRGRTRRVSVTPGGRPAGDAELPAISANGRFATFRTDGIFVRGPLR